jgi:hypothetical protein
MKKLFFFCLLFCSLWIIHPVFAEDAITVVKDPKATTELEQQNKSDNPMENSYKPLAPLPGFTKIDSSFTLSSYIRTLVRVAIGIIGILAVIMIVISGVQYMGSDMFTEKESAKSRLQGAVLGLILAVSSVLILRTINPGLTNIDLEKNLKENAGEITASALEIANELSIKNGNGGGKSSGPITPWDGKTNANRNVTDYDQIFKKYASQYGVNCTRLKSHAYVESNFKPNAVSPAGAVGLIQLMPETAKDQGFTSQEMKIPEKNIEAAAKYISKITKAGCPSNAPPNCNMTNTYDYIAAGYNGGQGVNSYATDCPKSQNKTKWQCETNRGGLQETYDYVGKINATYTILNKNGWGC